MKFLRIKTKKRITIINTEKVEFITTEDNHIEINMSIGDNDEWWSLDKKNEKWMIGEREILNFEELKKQIDEL